MNRGMLAQSSTHTNAHSIDCEGYDVITTFGNIPEEYVVLRETVGLCDFSTHGKFRISGPEHIDWLAKMVTRDLEFFDTEKTLFSLCLNEQGEVLGIVTLYKYEDAILVETETASRAGIAVWFAQHSSDDVVIEDVSDELTLIGFEGPLAFKVAQTLIDFEISSIPFQAFVEIEKGGERVMLARIGYTGEYGYKVFAPVNIASSLWNELYEKVQAVKGGLCGNDALEIAMLEVRQPLQTRETRDLNVRSAGLEWLIDFGKEAYIGKESIDALMREKVGQQLVGFTAPKSAKIMHNDRVMVEDQEIGKVVIARYSPRLQRTLGLALNKEPFTVPGLQWVVKNQWGEVVPALSISSPYVIPGSWIIKML